MSKSAGTKLDFLGYVFTGSGFPWGAATHLQVNLHNSDPTPSGIASEFSSVYGGYAPVVVERSGVSFIIGNPTVNAIDLLFPECTTGSDVITHVSISPVGFEQIIYYGTLGTPRIVTPGVKPEFKAGTLEIMEN